MTQHEEVNQVGEEPSADLFRKELKSEYEKDFDRKERLDNKASNLIAMAGIIATLFTGFGTFVLRDIDSPNPILLGISSIIMLFGLSLLIKTIQASVSAFKIADYKHVVIVSDFVQNDKFNNDLIRNWKQATKGQFNSRMIKDYLDASDKNSRLNENKADQLTKAQRVFLFAIITIPITAGLAILTKILNS